MDITRQQKETIRTLTRRANRRLERATPGQQKALRHYIGADKFSAATRGLSYAQAQQKIEQLQVFLQSKSSTRKGWDAIKARNVSKAAETFRGMGYDLSDEELAEILIQVDTGNTAEYYRAVNLVQAAKYGAELVGDLWRGTDEQIQEAIAERISAADALDLAKKLRSQVNEGRKEAQKKLDAIQKRKVSIRFNQSIARGKNPRKK